METGITQDCDHNKMDVVEDAAKEDSNSKDLWEKINIFAPIGVALFTLVSSLYLFILAGSYTKPMYSFLAVVLMCFGAVFELLRLWLKPKSRWRWDRAVNYIFTSLIDLVDGGFLHPVEESPLSSQKSSPKTANKDKKKESSIEQNKTKDEQVDKVYPNGIPIESSYKFKELCLNHSMVITPHVFKDDRGEFIEVFNLIQFKQLLGIDFLQDCTSVSRKNTLRGLHGDFRTWKLIHCPKGSVMACIIDLNPGSSTYFQSTQVLINDKNRALLLVPPGFGNSFYVLEEGTVYNYKKTSYFVPGAEFTLHYTCVQWPKGINPILSKRDLQAPMNRIEFESEMKKRSDLDNNPFLL